MNQNLDPRTVRFREEYQGKHFFTKDGQQEFVITDARTYGDVDIEFIGSGLKKNTKVGNIKNGLPNPFAKSCIAFEKPEYEYEGTVYRTNQGYNILITKYNGFKNVYYKFLDEYGYQGCTTIQNIKKGEVRNPYHKNEVGGYIGELDFLYNPKYREILNYIDKDKLYTRWYDMVVRGTGNRKKYTTSFTSVQIEAYDNCSIDPIWLNYTNYATWFLEEMLKVNPNYPYEVDKDILYPAYKKKTGYRKCYGPSYCILVPIELNRIYGDNNRKIDIINNIEEFKANGAISPENYRTLKRIYGDYRNIRELIS